MKKKAIIFDLDGTAIDSPKQKLPSDNLIRAIDKLKNEYYFCAATGRVWSFVKPVLQSLGLDDPCIISAGTQLCDPKTGHIIKQKTIPEKSLYQALEVFRRYADYKLLYNDNNENDYLYGGIHPHEINITEPVYFLEQIFIPDEHADKIHQEIESIDGITCVKVVAQKPGYKDLHVIHENATKEHAVADLIEYLGIRREDTIGIGDGHNDIHLFRAVDYKVAMGNAVPELKEMADTVIGSVQEDGMVAFLHSLV